MTSVTNVFVLGLTPVDEHVMPFADCLWYTNKAIAATEAALAEQCREADVPFLALHAEIQAQHDWLQWIEPDGLHLNATGHSWIYTALQQWPPLLQWAGHSSLNTPTPMNG
jgi:lysophospholipase L1-like esterase